MKITAAAFLFLACEAPSVYGFSSYLSQLSGGSTTPVSYAPKPQAPVTNNGDYLSVLSSPNSVLKFTSPELGSQQQPGASSSVGHARVSGSTVDYMSSLSGIEKKSVKAKAASYSGFNSNPKAATNALSGYLGNLGAGVSMKVSPPAPDVKARPVSPAPADYMASLGGKLSAVKPASYSGFNSKPKAVTSALSGYLGSINSETIASASIRTVSGPAVVAPAVAAADYLASLGGTSSAPKPASYSGFNSKPKAAKNVLSGYLGNLGHGEVASSSTASISTSTSTAPSAADYMKSLGGATGPMKKATYSGFNSKPQAPTTALSGYLGSLSTTSPVVSTATPSTSASVPTSADYMRSLGGSSGPMKKPTYSGFNPKPRAPESQGGYLAALTSRATVAAAASPEPVKKVMAASPADYMARLGAPTGPMKKASYAPFKPMKLTSPAPAALSGYLAKLNGTPATLSTFSSAPSIPATVPSTMAATVKKGSYSPFNTKPMAPAVSAFGGYLQNVNSAKAPATLPSYPTVSSAAARVVTTAPKRSSYSPFNSKPVVVRENVLGGWRP